MYHALTTNSLTSSQYIDKNSQDHRMWLRFLHCYLLPVITFQYEDLAAVSLAHSDHVQALHIIDEQLEDIASRSLKV